MKNLRRILMLTLVILVLMPGVASALLSDKKAGRWNLAGKFKTQASFRTEGSTPNTPIPIKAGDMTSQRNLLLMEFKHNVGDIWKDLHFGYYIQGQAFYDGAWDYGPDVMSDKDTRYQYCLDDTPYGNRGGRDQIDDLKWDVDLSSGYLEFTKGPVFSRIGKQVLCWGEMSTVRILDGTNPMNTSSMSVDMSERLMPLWMARLNFSFDFVGPFDSLSVQTYYVPGKIDNTYKTDMIDGSPIMPSIGRDYRYELDDPFSMAYFKELTYQEDDDLEDDRYGIKLGCMWGGLNAALAYYRMYSEMPIPWVNIPKLHVTHVDKAESLTPGGLIAQVLGGQKLEVILERQTVDVIGSSFNYFWYPIDSVIRGEAAYFFDVPKMSPETIPGLVGAIAPKIRGLDVFGGVTGLVNDVTLWDNEGRDAKQMILPFSCGEIATYDVIKYGIGIDKWVKIPLLNTSDFMLSLEYVGSKIQGYKEHQIMYPWTSPWDDNRDGYYDTVWEEEYSNTFVFITNTTYLSGNLNPRLVAMYEVEPQAIVLMPSITYTWKRYNFGLGYFMVSSKGYEGTMGLLDTKDEVSLSVTCNF